MRIPGDEQEEDEPPPDIVFEDILAVEADMEYDCDLWDILFHSAIEVWSSLRVDFSTIQEKCCLYFLDVAAGALHVLHTTLRGLTLSTNMVKSCNDSPCPNSKYTSSELQ